MFEYFTDDFMLVYIIRYVLYETWNSVNILYDYGE